MARLAVLTDRLPDDLSWKGAYTWEIILALAESQHEVCVLTTADPERIAITHPRLTVARPAPTWKVDRLPRWAQALVGLRPEVIHSFGLMPSPLWPKLTVWPYLDALARVLPGNVRRLSTMFDVEDCGSAADWHAGSERWTVFSSELAAQARGHYRGQVDLVPLDEIRAEGEAPVIERDFLLVPAPVSEWHHRDHTLARLAEHLRRNPTLSACINGGWGDLDMSERRAGWSLLADVATRVRLVEAQSLRGFSALARAAHALWLDGLAPDSWRLQICARLAGQLGRPILGPEPTIQGGSTANSLSRLYLT